MIEIDHLTKRYGSHTALCDLNLTVEPGQIYGFLGPNGAGKSTTMNIMTGCLAATEGTVRIDGYDIFEEPGKAKALIGYLPEQPPVYPDMTPREYLEFVAQAKGVDRAARGGQLDRAMEVTQIQTVQNRLIKNLSKGYKQRVGIAQALLGDPHVIILDEPTVGLDPIQIIEIRDLIKELGKNHTVILSSHILSEVRAVCQQIMILSKGRLVASDTPDNLEKLFAGAATLELTVKGGEEAVRSALAPVIDGGTLTCQPDGEGRLQVSLGTEPTDELSERVFYACAGAGLPILRMDRKKASLEDVFLELTAADAAEAVAPEEPPVDQKQPEEQAEEGGEGP